MIPVALKYRDIFFIKKVKEVLKSGEELMIEFYGRDTISLSKRIPLLVEIEESHYKKQKVNRPYSWQLFSGYFVLMFQFARFMVAFWMALAYGRRMRVQEQHDDFLAIFFEKKE